MPAHARSAPSTHPVSKTDALLQLDAVAATLASPVLSTNPFPAAIAARNNRVYERIAAFAAEKRRDVEQALERLRLRADYADLAPAEGLPEDWELSALDNAAREWRVYEAFRLLHERFWCPGPLFRLGTKTDLLVLCDRRASSAPEGYGERQRRVLGKRGIADRHAWVAARRLVAAMGLVEDDPGQGPRPGGAAQAALPESAEANVNATATCDVAGEASEEAMEDDGAEEVDEADPSVGEGEVATTEASPEFFPPLRLDPVWEVLPRYTKKQLEAVFDQYECGLWAQFAERFYASARKPDVLAYVRRVVRFQASLDAVQHLTSAQLDALHDWMRGQLTQPYHRDDDLRIAARLFVRFAADAERSASGRGLSPAAWNRYRDAELRRIGAFCYAHFYEGRRPLG
jgi:hypothetical protein